MPPAWSRAQRKPILTTSSRDDGCTSLNDNAERLIPDVISADQAVMHGFLELHLERYRLACEYARLYVVRSFRTEERSF
jgi:hypothetical protein